MGWKWGWVFFWLAAAPLCAAPRPFSFGHNYTARTETLPQGGVTLGTYAAAVGVTDWLMIGTSPWMLTFYNMPMVSARAGFDIFPGRLRAGLDFSYFRTVPGVYDQESTYARATVTQVFSDAYSLHLSLSRQGRVSGKRFYSIYLFDNSYADGHHSFNLTASSLHEIVFGDRFGLMLELGISALNYERSYHVFGASVYFRTYSGLFFQVGASYTRRNMLVGFDEDSRYPPSSFHPEVQLQWFI